VKVFCVESCAMLLDTRFYNWPPDLKAVEGTADFFFYSLYREDFASFLNSIQFQH